MEPDRAARQGGFTLLEVLIAFLIAALALGVLFRTGIESQGASAVSVRYQEAVSRARSRLAVLDGGLLAGGSDQQGDDGGGFRWRVRVSPLSSTEAAGGPTLYGVSVAVSWTADRRERSVQIETQRLGIAPPRQP